MTKDNMLYKLAETMATVDDLLTMVALRRLAQAGYGNLDEMGRASELLGVAQGSAPAVPAGQPVEKRLALELLSEATHEALGHCPLGELAQTLRQISHDRHPGARQDPEPPCCAEAQVEPEPVIRPETDHFAYPHRKRRQIVEHYRDARGKGQIVNKERWAQMNYRITSKTLLSYEREYERAGASRP